MVDSSLGSMTLLALGSFLGFRDQIWFSILLREPLVTTNICIPPLNLQDYHGMLVVVLPGHYGWVGLLVVLQLGRTIHCFPLLEACITCSSSTKTSPQEGAFQVRSTPSPGLFSKVHDVFSNKDYHQHLGSKHGQQQ